MKKLLPIFIIIIFANCTNKNLNKNEIHFTRTDFKSDTSLKGEIIEFNKPNLPYKFTIIRDTLIFVTNLKADPYYIEIYSLNSKNIITRLARRGRGPNEFLSCDLIYRTNNDDYICLFDITTKIVTKYNIDSILLKGITYSPQQIKLPGFTKTVAFLGSDTIIGYNFFYFDNLGITNKANSLFKLRTDKDLRNKISDIGNKYFTANVSGGDIIASPVDDKIWLVNHYKDQIDFFNEKLELINSIIGPDLMSPEFIVKDNKVSFKDRKYYRAYYPVFFTNNAVFIIYLGANGIPNNQEFRKPVEIFKLSWGGELLCRYQLDRFIYSISLDSNEKFLYGTTDNPLIDEYPQIVRYTLK
jgi:hypothetical protein